MAGNDKRLQTIIEARYPQSTSASKRAGICLKTDVTSHTLSQEQSAPSAATTPKANCYNFNISNYKTLSGQDVLIAPIATQIAQCRKTQTSNFSSLLNSQSARHKHSIGLARCAHFYYKKTGKSEHQHRQFWKEAKDLQNCTDVHFKQAQQSGHCFKMQHKKTVPVPMEYYPIVLPDEPPRDLICPLPPSSRALALELVRTRTQSPKTLPLPLNCWNKQHPFIDQRPDEAETYHITPKESYIMQNYIIAKINNKQVEILSFNIQSDVDSFCWQVSAEIPVSEKENIPSTEIGFEAILSLEINGEKFKFLIEGKRDNRQFIGDSITLTGRSQTAHLGADYAQFKTGQNAEAYARQIADEVLQFTDYSTKWQIANWLIPADTYSYTGKSPLAIIQELADVAGGFLTSHPSEKQLILKRRWGHPAWEIKEASPHVVLPSSVILSISGEESINQRANVVYIMGEEGAGKAACVYREQEGRDAPASTIKHSLFTDLDVLREAGINALSNTGKHKRETVTTLYNTLETIPKTQKDDEWQTYNPDKKEAIPPKRDIIPRAELGDIWQIEERGEHWQGVVVAVAISGTIDNGAPLLTQSITIDRYLDK